MWRWVERGVDKNHESTGLIGPNLNFTPPPLAQPRRRGFIAAILSLLDPRSPFFLVSPRSSLMPGHEIWKKGKTSPRYLPDLRGIPYNHVHTCICIYLIIIIASVRTADTNLRLAIPNDSFASHKCHLSGSPCHHHT